MLNLNLKFKNKNLLRQALTHRSYLNESPNLELDHNERLEFLGDAVLELVVTEYLYQNYKSPEGELTSWRAALVNAEMLSKKAKELGLNDEILLSKGEAKDTGKGRNYILANALEALIGAIYLDQGYEATEKFIKENILIELPSILENKLYLDAKSQFQERAQEEVNITPEYKVLKEWGPDHDKKFKIGVCLGLELVATAIGSSKQESQQKAAEKALKVKKW